MTDCTYCGCAVEAHDPVFVYEERDSGQDDERDGRGDDDRDDNPDDHDRELAGQFCNYACLSAHVEEADLADGARCRLDA